MKRLGLAFVFGMVSLCAHASDVYEQKGVGYSIDKKKACAAALDYLKKQSLIRFGAIIPTKELPSVTVASSSVESTVADGASQLSETLVKVLSKKVRARRVGQGNYVCTVEAKLSVDVNGVIKHNLTFKGKYPAWMVVPPSEPGKITVIAKSKTLDGAIARSLHKYAEITIGEAERIKRIEDLLSGKSSLYKREVQITPDISVKWKRKYYMLGDDQEPLFIHTFSEKTIFQKDGKIRQLSEYREIQSENGFVSNFEDENSGETKGKFCINRASASLKMLLNSLKESGFEIQYKQVGNGRSKEWYVLLVGKPLLPKS
ncbi:MAG: hypothetical protein R8K20_00855 [Gallionellaceae bacterium]